MNKFDMVLIKIAQDLTIFGDGFVVLPLLFSR